MTYAPGWEDPSDAHASSGGVLGLMKTALWASAGLATVVMVVIGAYSLGARDAGDVVAMRGEGWRSRPEAPGGALTPGAGSAAFDPIGDAAERGGDLLVGPDAERPSAADIAAAEERAALEGGDPVTDAAFLEYISDAVGNPEAPQRRRTVELEPPLPREGEVVAIGPEREDLPPNVGEGSLAEPPSTTPYRAGAAGVDAPPDAADAPLAALESPLEAAPGAPPAAGLEALPTPEASLSPAEEPPAAAPPSPAREESRPAGDVSFQVQLAALDSEDAVRQRWDEIKAQHGDLVAGLELEIQQFNIDSLKLYRLRVGNFGSRREASQLCAQLSSRGVDCFPANR